MAGLYRHPWYVGEASEKHRDANHKQNYKYSQIQPDTVSREPVDCPKGTLALQDWEEVR